MGKHIPRQKPNPSFDHKGNADSIEEEGKHQLGQAPGEFRLGHRIRLWVEGMGSVARTQYFSSPVPRVLAHRGLHLNDPAILENSLDAFSNALRFGVTHIESDVHSTRDDVAVLFHDSDLRRSFSRDLKISQITWEELQEISQGTVPSLDSALRTFPNTFWNLDLKSKMAIAPTVQTIEELGAHERVLISSFSDSRRKKALQLLSQPVATSAGTSTFIKAYLSHSLLFGLGLKSILKEVDALQIPTRQGFLRFDSEGFIRRLRELDKEVHFWTINEIEDMRRLLKMGAHGIVTDRVDIAATL